MSHKEFENNTSRTSTVVTAPQDQNNDSSSNSSTAITPNPHDFHTILVQTLQAVQETNERLRRVEGRLDSIEAAMRSIVEPSHTSNKRRCKENGPVPSEENFHDAPMQQQLEYIFEAVKLAHHEAQSLKEASVQPKNNMDAEEREKARIWIKSALKSRQLFNRQQVSTQAMFESLKRQGYFETLPNTPLSTGNTVKKELGLIIRRFKSDLKKSLLELRSSVELDPHEYATKLWGQEYILLTRGAARHRMRVQAYIWRRIIQEMGVEVENRDWWVTVFESLETLFPEGPNSHNVVLR